MRELGYITDRHFSPSLVRLPLDAMADLVEMYIDESDHDAIRAELIKAGATDDSLRGILKEVLKKLLKKWHQKLAK